MVWQDIVLTASNFVFIFSLIPQVHMGFKDKKGYITLLTSTPTFIAVFFVSYAFYTLNLLMSSITAFVVGVLWFLLFYQALTYRKA